MNNPFILIMKWCGIVLQTSYTNLNFLKLQDFNLAKVEKSNSFYTTCCCEQIPGKSNLMKKDSFALQIWEFTASVQRRYGKKICPSYNWSF